MQSASGDETNASGASSIRYGVAAGRAAAWERIGDAKRAAEFQEEAVGIAPELPQAWLTLAQFYESQGRSEDASHAKARADSLTASHAQ